MFPVLDITRLGIRNLAVNSALCSEDTGDFLLSSLNQKLSSQVDTNRMLALRVFSNMLQHPPGRDLALKNKDMILLSMSVSSMDFSAASKHLQVKLSILQILKGYPNNFFTNLETKRLTLPLLNKTCCRGAESSKHTLKFSWYSLKFYDCSFLKTRK